MDRENLVQERMDTEDGTVPGAGGTEREYPSLAYIDELLRRCHVPVARNLRERMVAMIDEEVTAEATGHVVINYGFHEELDRAKETFETLDGKCERPILNIAFFPFERDALRSRAAAVGQASRSHLAQGCVLATGQ